MCRSCEICGSRRSLTKTCVAPLQPIKAERPLHQIALDITGPFPVTEMGNRYIDLSDYFTKWTEAVPIPNMEAVMVANVLFVVPEIIHSDQGRKFESTLIKEICRLLHITKTHTSPYHPQCDRLVEHFNRILLGMLRSCTQDDKNWDLHLPPVMLAYRPSVQEMTGATPYYLVFGQEAKLPIGLIFNVGSASFSPLINMF